MDWALDVNRKCLIVGDSSLCSLPDYFNRDLQIESFPGSHFRHAQALMEKTVPLQDLVVEKRVLSFGINSRSNKSKETTVKNMQGALGSTKQPVHLDMDSTGELFVGSSPRGTGQPPDSEQTFGKEHALHPPFARGEIQN